MAEDDTVVSKAFSGKTCRVVRNAYTQHYEEHPEELKPFPAQLLASMEDGANHLGAGPDTEVDPDREFWPAGQGVGAIDELIPAGDLVRQFVAEAEAVFERVGARR
jgi:enoyl-[acyl-carrier protein] reductase II